MAQLKTKHLQQKIVRFVVVGILLTGLLLSATAVLQAYFETRRHTEALTSAITLGSMQLQDAIIHGSSILDLLLAGSSGQVVVELSDLPKIDPLYEGQIFFQPLPNDESWVLVTLLPDSQVTLSIYRVTATSLTITLLIVVVGAFFITYKVRPLLRQLDQSNQQQQLSEQRIHYLVHHDQLTGLPNWSQLYDSLCERMSKVAQQQDQQLAILFINLSRFKVVNESLGHDVGNQVLMLMADRLKQFARTDDLLARAGGDEFLLCVKVTQGVPLIDVLTQQILDTLKQPFSLQGKTICLEATVGISLFPDDATQADALLRHADAALTRARRLGQGRYQFFEADMSEQSREKFELETDLRGALQRNEFEVYYQPQIDLRSHSMSGAEALIRWNHPTRGRVPPDQFIPIAEETGLIHSIGHWVLEESCRQARIWQEEGHFLKVSVNLSALQLNNGDIVDIVRTVLEQTGLESRWLELELTESYLFENFVRSARVLKRLRLLGVTLALDDFGTGYSSLSYLRRLTLHRLKIDRSFVKGLPGDPGDLAIVTTIIAMSKSLGLEVVAEGVETAEQRQSLSQLGCHAYQGYYYAAPESALAFRARLSDFKVAQQY